MRKWDAETEEFMQQWTEKEVRTAIGASPSCTVQDDEHEEEYEPKGPNAWFGYAVAKIVTLVTLRRMSETWRVRPPYPDWRYYTPAIRQHADEQIRAAQLPPSTPLAQWFPENELLLQRELSSRARSRVVAAALLPLFEKEPDCWAATKWLDDDFSCGTFAGYLAEWHAQVPQNLRRIVRQIAREFGVEIEDERAIGNR